MRFLISITCEKELNLEEIWPDGDAPKDPSEEDVQRLIERDGGPLRVLVDWNLCPEGGQVSVTKVGR